MRESALFGIMFGLGAGAVLVGVTVSRLVVGQTADKAVEEPVAVVETASRAVAEPAPPAAVSAPLSTGMAMAGQHRLLPRKHRRAPVEEAARKPAPVVKDTAPTASTVTREAPPAAPPPGERPAPKPEPVAQDSAPTASAVTRQAPAEPPPRAELTDAPSARHGPIAVVRGGTMDQASPGPGARIIQIEPQGR